MSFYSEVPNNIMNKIVKYKGKFETSKISLPFEYNENIYYKIIFIKKNLFKHNDEPKFIFVDKNGEIVEKSIVQKELERLMYYFEIFFDENSNISIYKTVQNELEINKKNSDMKDAIKGLDCLNRKKIKGIDEVKSVIQDIPDLRNENNIKIKETIKLIDEIKNNKSVINEKTICEVYESYEQALLCNFKIIKLAAKCRNYYSAIKKSIENNRKLFTIVIGGKKVNYINKATYTINFLSKIVTTYESVLNLSSNQYIRYLKEAEKQIINEKMKSLRKL